MLDLALNIFGFLPINCHCYVPEKTEAYDKIKDKDLAKDQIYPYFLPSSVANGIYFGKDTKKNSRFNTDSVILTPSVYAYIM